MTLRLIGLLALGALIVGPAPGSTGGCGNADEPAPFVSSCSEWRAWDCVRDRSRGDLADDDELQACVDAENQACMDIGDWPLDCQPFPTMRAVNNCVEQLQRADMVNVPLEELPECDFCP